MPSGPISPDQALPVRAQDIAKAFERLSYFVEGSGHR